MTRQPSLDARLHGSRRGQVLRELLGNSAHFPVANLFYEGILEGGELLHAPDPYVLVGACLLQAWLLGTWQHEGRPRPFLGNLIGPASYTLVEGMFEGMRFFAGPHHVAYWAFSLLIGAIQQIQLRPPAWAIDVCLSLVEGLARAGILFLMYWLLELGQDAGAPRRPFFADASHVYIALALGALGLLVGLLNVHTRRGLRLLRDTADQLRRFSEWAWGRELVARAIDDSEALALKRLTRGIVFADIRGFTAWSERQSPEIVVAMLNRYYAMGEAALRDRRPVKSKYSADEAMIVFAAAREAVAAGDDVRTAAGELLAEYDLSVGVGVHCGPTVEGLLGSPQVRLYDVIGDTVNVAKRLCDQAAGLEPASLPRRTLNLKGKSEPLEACAL